MFSKINFKTLKFKVKWPVKLRTFMFLITIVIVVSRTNVKKKFTI